MSDQADSYNPETTPLMYPKQLRAAAGWAPDDAGFVKGLELQAAFRALAPTAMFQKKPDEGGIYPPKPGSNPDDTPRLIELQTVVLDRCKNPRDPERMHIAPAIAHLAEVLPTMTNRAFAAAIANYAKQEFGQKIDLGAAPASAPAVKAAEPSPAAAKPAQQPKP